VLLIGKSLTPEQICARILIGIHQEPFSNMEHTAPRPFVFVLMPFEAKFDDHYRLGIKAAAEDAGYYCERLDEQIFEETMLARIYNQIAKADVVVADMTGRNPNVFYEVGYAHALNKRTILLTSVADDIPFDLRHHFHIVYKGRINDLKKMLGARLSYYKVNPNAMANDPFSSLKLIVNGTPIDFTSEFRPIVKATAGIDGHSGALFMGISVDVAIHLPVESVEESFTCDFLLLSDISFPRCAGNGESGGRVIYSSIKAGNKQIVHKPLSALHVLRGGWDTASFHLMSQRHVTVRTETQVCLRLICQGLVRDVEITIDILKKKSNRPVE